ncbi:MAG: hypothetical protein ABSH46_18010 [Bryobacteraceae bacterium]
MRTTSRQASKITTISWKCARKRKLSRSGMIGTTLQVQVVVRGMTMDSCPVVAL